MNFIKKIDDLGRIVIPKEVRRFLEIQNNEYMEIKINNDEIILKKYSIIDKKEHDIIKICKIISALTTNNIILTDREKIIYSNIDSLKNKELTSNFKEIIINRKEFKNDLEIVENYKIKEDYKYLNLIIDSDLIGIIIMFGNDVTDIDRLLLEIVSKYINVI